MVRTFCSLCFTGALLSFKFIFVHFPIWGTIKREFQHIRGKIKEEGKIRTMEMGHTSSQAEYSCLDHKVIRIDKAEECKRTPT